MRSPTAALTGTVEVKNTKQSPDRRGNTMLFAPRQPDLQTTFVRYAGADDNNPSDPPALVKTCLGQIPLPPSLYSQ